MLKKILSLLLISILAISVIGNVTAQSYTYPLDIYIGDTFELGNWMDSHGISSIHTGAFEWAFRDSNFFSVSQEDWSPLIYITALKIGQGTLKAEEGMIFDDDYINFNILPIRTELDFSNITQDSNGLVKGSITLWSKDKWGNIQKTLPNQKLNISFTKDKEYHDGIIETDSSGVAHLADLQLCLDHAGVYNVHARFDPINKYGQFDVDTTFNSYP